jgi:hypothetical protein
MPTERVPLGDILILRSGLQDISCDTENLAAKRKQARMLMECLDELIERREKDAGNG